MADTGTRMWAEACELLERAERLHRQFFQVGRPGARRPTWEPPVDVFETQRELWILVALPGVAAERVEVALDGATLVVAGDRPMPGASRAAQIHRLEIPYGRFERRLELPGGRFQLDRREVVNGCLVLTLLKLP